MPVPRAKKPSRGSVTLKFKISGKNATRDLADEMGKGSDLVSRWATGGRKPKGNERAKLQRKYGIPWLDWEIPLTEQQADALYESLKEASAEPASTFPVGDKPANGGAGHAA